MAYSDGALREGVMYDLLGRFRHVDIRDRSVQAMMARYHADVRQAERVVNTARQLFEPIAVSLELDADSADLLRRAAYLHEVGLAISHGGYHRHGAYLLQHSDIPGFSQVDQSRLALLVGNHRRKLKLEQKELLLKTGGHGLVYLCLLLRLAVLLHHSRSDQHLPKLQLSISEPTVWQLVVSEPAQSNLLFLADLQEEQQQFAHWGIGLQVLNTSPQEA
jgi:exopolyphosphatase/guanosine-5'-triphosphate,3'-diphosphate pyrophosphatase